MIVTFYKYQGTGNDFIMIDNRNQQFDTANYELIAQLCERRMGIGADGLILLQNKTGYDFEMVYYNADGRPGSMCGNGGRCTVQFAKQLGVITDKAFFLAADGDHYATVEPSGEISLRMNDVQQVELGPDFYFLDTGSPHYVQFVEELTSFNVFSEGRGIRYNNRFKQVGTNVNFAEWQPTEPLFVRTYERGVEDETFSCGTGVTATALAASYKGATSPVSIRTLGGNLMVSFEATPKGFTNIYLIGPAQHVFTGTINC